MSRRGTYRGIYSSLPDDPDFQTLTPHARLIFYTARCCPDVGPGCIFRFYPEVLAKQSGLSLRDVNKALTELQAADWVRIEGPVLWIRNGLRYDPTFRLADPKHQKAVMTKVESLPRLKIVLSFCEYYDLPRPFEGPSKPLGRPIPEVRGSSAPRPISDIRYPSPNTDIRIPSAEGSEDPSKALGSTPSGPARTRIQFQIAPDIVATLDRCRTLGQAVKLRDPGWWQAEVRANRTVDYPAELLRAEAWIATHPERAPRSNHARFMHSWFARATEHNSNGARP